MIQILRAKCEEQPPNRPITCTVTLCNQPVRESVLGCGVRNLWLEKVGRTDSACIGSHQISKNSLPYLTNIAPSSMGFLRKGATEWPAYPANLSKASLKQDQLHGYAAMRISPNLLCGTESLTYSGYKEQGSDVTPHQIQPASDVTSIHRNP